MVSVRVVLRIALTVALCTFVYAQNGPTPAPQREGNRAPVRRSVFPERPTADPATVERGKGLFTVNCAFCHGSDARGGEGGPNLLRSQIVLSDKNGEQILPVVQNGRPGGMPKFNLTADQVSEIAAFLHSFPVSGRDFVREEP